MHSRAAVRLALALLAVGLWLEGHAVEPAKPQLVEDFDATWKEDRWQFSNGPEFPGAKGSFERSKEGAHSGEFGGKLSFDFAGGGNYVAAILKLSAAPDIKAVRVWLKNPDGSPRQVWITEMGWATHVPHNSMSMDFNVTPQRKQAELIARAYATMTRMIQGMKLDKPLDLDPGVIAYRFTGGGAAGAPPAVICLWSSSGDKTVAIPAAKPMVLTGLMGDTQDLASAAGKVTVPLRAEAPVFLTETPE